MSTSNGRSVAVVTAFPPEPRHKEAMLPPLTSQFPQWSRTAKIGPARFPKPPFPNANIMNQGGDNGRVRRGEPVIANHDLGLTLPGPLVDPIQRVVQLEQNIRFLQEQHSSMLNSLHSEIEMLRQRNRELQFQLIMTNGSVNTSVTLLPSIPPSPEDDTRPRVIITPRPLSVAPLQVEMLENEVKEIQSTLHEEKSKNLFLSNLVEDQRRRIEELEMHDSSTDRSGGTASVDDHTTSSEVSVNDPDHYADLEEADTIIRHLRKENVEQKRELIALKGSLSKVLSGGRRRQFHSDQREEHSSVDDRRGGRGGGGGHQQRFPPLHSTTYWKQRPDPQYQRSQNGDHVDDKQQHHLPSLGAHQQTYHRGRGRHSPRYNRGNYHHSREEEDGGKGEGYNQGSYYYRGKGNYPRGGDDSGKGKAQYSQQEKENRERNKGKHEGGDWRGSGKSNAFAHGNEGRSAGGSGRGRRYRGGRGVGNKEEDSIK